MPRQHWERLFVEEALAAWLASFTLCSMYQVYKSFPYHPRNSTFDPEFSLSKEDISFLVDNGFNVVRLYVAWPGVEPSEGQYNDTYLDVSGYNHYIHTYYYHTLHLLYSNWPSSSSALQCDH